MKNIFKLSILCFAVFLSSCEGFLDKTPLDTISEADFYKTATDLRTALNNNYQDFPGWSALTVGYSVLPDSYTDMGTSESPSNRLSGLDYTVPSAASNSVWSFDEVREMNWFLDHVDQASGDEVEINHYIGEGYFFRAYYYYELLKKYGDLPILDKYFDNLDEEYVYAKRAPRSEVVDFMLSDLNTAISLLKSFNDITIHPRISKEMVQLFKARVALYEGSWERYHSGTDLGVDGSDGSAYLQIAADAAEEVIDAQVFSLHSDYSSLFNQSGLSGNSEVMFWRDYDYSSLTIGNPLQISWPNRSAYTRAAVRSYLCDDGKPISVSPQYVGDHDLSTIETNRDPRLAATIMVPGDLLVKDTDGSETYYANPAFSVFGTGNTGYASQKYRDPNIDPNTPGEFTRNTSKIIMRYAEAYLIFAEAKAELGTITQNDLDKSINKLRTRVNMPGITLGGITADPDWPNYGYTLSDILYEVRRERSVELMGEGFRSDDLYRWRAHSLFDQAQPKGAYYDDGIMGVELTPEFANVDADGYIQPFFSTGDYNFDTKAYLQPIPADEIVLNPNLIQNPGW